jgi:hypothetical protein
VDRVGGDYPRMIPVSNPQMRPEYGMEIAKYSQRHADLIDLKTNRFATCSVSELLEEANYPNLYLFASIAKEGYLFDPVSSLIQESGRELVLTFSNLLNQTSFAKVLGEMVSILEKTYGHPIETEFTASIGPDRNVRVNLLQCRPMWIPGTARTVVFPNYIPHDKVLFRANRFISGGVVRPIRYIIYIDPRRYASIDNVETKKSLRRIVGHLNVLLRDAQGKILMMGPGRWGSSNIDLGVNVTYADIDNAAVLVEIAREEAGHVPEVSYGTHFFQDLVEGQVIYLPIYPDQQETEFNEAFFDESPNALRKYFPEAARYEDLVRLIDIGTTGNTHAEVVADPQSRRAVCYLEYLPSF